MIASFQNRIPERLLDVIEWVVCHTVGCQSPFAWMGMMWPADVCHAIVCSSVWELRQVGETRIGALVFDEVDSRESKPLFPPIQLGFSDDAIRDGNDGLMRVLVNTCWDVTDMAGHSRPIEVTKAWMVTGRLALEGVDPYTDEPVVMYDVAKVVYE